MSTHHPSPATPRRKKIAFIAVTVVLGGLVFAAFAEMTLRFVPNPWMPVFQNFPDETLGWRHKPNTWGLHAWPANKRIIRTNAFGMSDRPRTLAKMGKYRIAVLGGSYAVGHTVPPESVFTRVMEDHVPGIEVLNFGVVGYGTAQMLLQYRTLIRRFSPDLVLVLAAAYNDVGENSIEMELLGGHPLEEVRRRPFLEIGDDGSLVLKPVLMSDAARKYINRKPYTGIAALKHWLVDNLMIMRFLHLLKEDIKALFSSAPQPADTAATPMPREDFNRSAESSLARERANRVTEHIFRELANDVRADGGRLLLVSNTALSEVEKATSDGLLASDLLVKRFADAAEAMFVPLSPCFFEAMREAGRNTSMFMFTYKLAVDPHWSESGHAAAARCILADLQGRGLIGPVDLSQLPRD